MVGRDAADTKTPTDWCHFMSIQFTEEQIKTISLDILGIPVDKSTNATNSKNLEDEKAKVLKKDQGHEVFYNFYLNATFNYHAELSPLSGELRTNYDTSTLISGAKQENNTPHYPVTPAVWTKFPPKQIASNTGLPTTTVDCELSEIIKSNDQIALLKTGFSSGSLTDTAFAAFSGGQVDVTLGGFSVGQTCVISDTGGAVYGTITAVTPLLLGPPAEKLTITTILSVGTTGIGAAVRNFHPGFSNFERENGPPGSESQVFSLFSTEAALHISNVKTHLNSQLSALNLQNLQQTAEIAEINTAKTQVTTAIGVITTWESAPAFGVGTGKWGDTSLNLLQSSFTLRSGTQVPARITQINARLGVLNQDSEGVFTGNGHYFDLFKWIDQRISRVEGTLLTYYGQELGKAVFAKQKTMLENRDNDYTLLFFVTRMSAAGDGTNKIVLDSISRLLVNDDIKLITDGLPVLNLKVVALFPNRVVQLNTTVGNIYTRNGNGRVVKLL